jgi:hypothetical protein
MADANVTAGTSREQQTRPCPCSDKAHSRQKIGNLEVVHGDGKITVDDLRYRLVLVAESATLLEQHLEHDRQGAALAGLLHQEAARIADTLDTLFEREVADA